ncbi:MAG: DUF938 domain-containing protein [Alphaproteobacteria bacterium]|nr:DUF938 domain-containing protein [Alphaproteobacteria bacterium]
MTQVKLCPPAAVRNAEPILAVLRSALPTTGTVLEIASGSGFHVAHFAKAFPGVTWQPSDLNPEARASIAAHIADDALPNVLPPLALDVTVRPWPIASIDAVICINMIHISPWRATEALFAGAGEKLARNAVLFTYGPYVVDGDFIAESNKAFDQDLRNRNPEWGLREVTDIETVADRHGFARVAMVAMPANNFTLVFRKIR